MDLTNNAATGLLGPRRLLTAARSAFAKAMADKMWGKKTLRIMKLSAILMLAACLQVTAKGLSQTVTLSVKNAAFEKVLLEIRRQTGYQFMYGTNMFQNAGTVTVTINNAPLEEALGECFKGKPFTYVIVNKTKW